MSISQLPCRGSRRSFCYALLYFHSYLCLWTTVFDICRLISYHGVMEKESTRNIQACRCVQELQGLEDTMLKMNGDLLHSDNQKVVHHRQVSTQAIAHTTTANLCRSLKPGACAVQGTYYGRIHCARDDSARSSENSDDDLCDSLEESSAVKVGCVPNVLSPRARHSFQCKAGAEATLCNRALQRATLAQSTGGLWRSTGC